MNKNLSLLIVASAALGVGILLAASVSGPYYTTDDLQSPQPSWSNVELIKQKVGISLVAEGGDKVILCNSNVCITYTRTDSAGWLGGPPARQVVYPPLDGGSRYDRGDVRQSTGGANSGGKSSSGGGSRGGRTEVRPLQPV